MAGITKQKRSYINQPIGVTRFETGEDKMWESVANSASQLNQIALKEGARQAEKSGFDAAMAVDRANLVAFDAETGAPKALDASLFSAGIIAKDAYNKIIQSRFRDSIEEELKNKAGELQLKYRYEPKLFREEMSRYVADMHENAQGKWKETIKVAGTAIVNSTGLFIEGQAKQKQDKVLGDYLENKANKVLQSEIIYILNSGPLENTLTSALGLVEETYKDLLNGASANGNYIISNEAAEDFYNKGLVQIYTRKLQFEFENSIHNIPLNDLGNLSRTNVLSALKNQNSSQLNKNELKLYDSIFEFAKERPALLSSVADRGANFVSNMNEQATNAALQNTYSDLALHKGEMKQKIDVINQSFFLENWKDATLLDGSLNNLLETARSENIKVLSQYGNSETDQIQASLAKDELTLLEDNISRNIISKLVLGKETNRANHIKAKLLSVNYNEISFTKDEQQLIDFFHNNNLSIQGKENIFNTAAAIFAGDKGKRREKQLNLANKKELEFLAFSESTTDFDAIINMANGYRADVKEGAFVDLNATSKGAFLNTINAIVLKASVQRIGKFNNLIEVSAAKEYLRLGEYKLKKGEKTVLDNSPRIKKVIDETMKLPGATNASFIQVLNQATQHHNALNRAAAAEAKSRKLFQDINNGVGNTKAHEDKADELLETLSNGLTHRQNLTNGKNPEYINQLHNLMLLGTMPTSFGVLLENFANNQGNFNELEAAQLLNLSSAYMNGLQAHSGENVNLFTDKLKPKTQAILKIASTLSISEGSNKSLEFIARAIEINSGEFNDDIARTLGINSIGEIEQWIASVKDRIFGRIGKDIVKDSEALAVMTELAKYGAIKGMSEDAINDLIAESFRGIYLQTEGYVKDFGNQDSNRSRHALNAVFTQPEIKAQFISSVSNELQQLGYTFGKTEQAMWERRARIEPEIEKGIAVLVPTMGSNQEVIYIAYHQNDETGELTLIKKPTDDGNFIPLAFSTTEKYLQSAREDLRVERKKLDVNKILESDKYLEIQESKRNMDLNIPYWAYSM